MSEDVGKYYGGKILSAVLAVGVVVVVIWYWRLPAADRSAMWRTVRGALIWLGFVGVLPWATFFVPARVVRMDSNRASAVMLVGYLAVDIALSFYLMGGAPDSGWERIVVCVGWLLAATYNYAACEWIARRIEDSA